MTIRHKILIATGTVALTAAPPAIAGDGFSHVDVYATHPAVDYTGVAGGGGSSGSMPAPRTVEVDDEGDGLGLKAAWLFTDYLFVTGEYELTDMDESGLDLLQRRLGAGARLPITGGVAATGRLEYADVAFDVPDGTRDNSGLGTHAGLRVAPVERLRGYAEIGYLSLSDADGEQYTVGADLAVVPGHWGVFVEYRGIRLDADGSDGELDIDDIRVGLRFFLGE